MIRTMAVVSASVMALLVPGTSWAAPDRSAEAAMAVAKQEAECPSCEYEFASKSPQDSARRGLVTIVVGAPEGGGYVMTMAHTGSRWGVLWAGNGTTLNPGRMPSRIAICMDDGGWTNVRKGPGLGYARVGKISRPTAKKAFEARLTSDMRRDADGVAWFRITYNGRPAWVQNLRTVGAVGSSAAAACDFWSEYRSAMS